MNVRDSPCVKGGPEWGQALRPGEGPAQSNPSAPAPPWGHLFRDISAVMSQFITFSYYPQWGKRLQKTTAQKILSPKPTLRGQSPAGPLRITLISGWHPHSLATSELRAANRLHQEDDSTKVWNIPVSRSTDHSMWFHKHRRTGNTQAEVSIQ